MTWCTDVSVIPEHGMSISGSAWDSRLRPAPFELIRRTKPCQDTAVKRHLPQDIWLLFICLWKKVYICTKLQATCFEEFFVNILSRPSHDILQSPNYVFMSNLVTWWIQIDFMLHIIPCIRPEGKLKSVRAAKIRLGTADGRLNWHLIYLHNRRWITFRSQEELLGYLFTSDGLDRQVDHRIYRLIRVPSTHRLSW